jgi:hypothetical protein
MAENPLRKSDRILQQKREAGDVKQSITLFDVDYAMMTYLEDVVLPKLDINGQSVKIPVIYGNSERWNGARRDGVYRDTHGKIQLPLMMLKRTTVQKNDMMQMPNRQLSYQAVTKYSKQNRYDRFSIMTNQKPKYDVFNITMPDYVEINYDCMGWTSYTEHLNTIIESLTWASDEYWGDKTKFKFNTSITDYNVVHEVGSGTERINRVEFTLNVKAYLLPEKFDGENTTIKSQSLKRIVVATETDVTANGRLEQLLVNTSDYNSNKDEIDFLTINNSKAQNPITNNTITFLNVKLVKAPGVLAGLITGGLTVDAENYDVKVYIDGVRYYETTHFTATYSTNPYSLTIDFIYANIGFFVTPANQITITGKFINI